MCVRRQRNAIRRIVEQPRKSTSHVVCFLECLVPHIIHQLGGVEPCLLLRLERDIGPCLVRVSGEKDSFSNAKASVVLGKLVRIYHSSERIAQRSGNAGWFSVFIRYSAPAEPPAPAFVPIVRCTIFTCRYLVTLNAPPRSTSRSAIDATVGFLRYTSMRMRCTSGDGSIGSVTSRLS